MGKLEDWRCESFENPYDLEVNEDGELVVVRTDTDSLINVKKEVLPNNSVTKQIFEDLKKEE